MLTDIHEPCTGSLHRGDHLVKAATRVGLDFGSMEKAIENPDSYDREIEKNHHALSQAGHWGVPTFVFNGEPFFGQDRIETLRRRFISN